MLLTPATRLGPYEIIAPLGAGGMGEVYRARDTRLEREVAIKALPAPFAADPERLARFRREAQTLASLNHPNIAAIYGLEEVSGAPYLVLELVEGETLAGHLARGPLPAVEALRLGVHVAAALEAAHERGIVHRDLKPGNIMITLRGAAKVLDFGLAKTDGPPSPDSGSSVAPTRAADPAATVAGTILGTVAYMSPEQARGKQVDRRTDVWAFGCVLFECLAGRPAFGGETPSDLIARIHERDPDWTALPGGTSPRTRELLRRCLRKDADARPRDMRDVRLELEEISTSGAKPDASREQSIAVLPFANQSGPDDEYFADGITDEVLNALAQLEGLRVAARTSCFAFKGRHEDLRLVAEKLAVDTVLEGTVRRSGSRLRITAQLVNAADGYQLWSERYDREMTDVFEIQDEIANAIATRLRGALHARKDLNRPRGTRNLEAYELLLRGRALQDRRGRFLVQAIVCFEQAVALDPEYAEAMAWLADSYRLVGVFGAVAPDEVMPKAKALADRALAIDPGLAHAWTTLAAVEWQYAYGYERSNAWYARALEIDPRNSQARAQRALWQAFRGGLPMEQCLAEMRRALQDDPLNAWVGGMHAFALGIAGRHEESIGEAERSFAVDPDSFLAHWEVMRSHAWAGHYERAIQEAPSLCAASGRHPWVIGLLAWTYAHGGRPDDARACYDELEARSRHTFMPPSWLAVAAASAGLMDDAIRWMEKAVAEHDSTVLWERLPFFDAVRAHPRFDEVTRPLRQ